LKRNCPGTAGEGGGITRDLNPAKSLSKEKAKPRKGPMGLWSGARKRA